MASELRQQILEFEDVTEEEIVVPEWGNIEITVRSMTGLERAKFLRNVTGRNGDVDMEKFYPDVIIATAHDGEGNKIFEPADRDALNAKSGAALQRLAETALRISGLSDGASSEAEDELKNDQS